MSEAEGLGEYPGLTRQRYFVGKIVMIFAVIFTMMMVGPGSPVMRFLGLAVLTATVVMDVLRLQNMGASQWWAFIRFLPFGNLVLDIGLQSAQTGWAETRRLDATGKRILITELVFLGLMLLLASRAGMSMPYLY
jgi:uncharacterized membrane protein YhaH (DUF805 family)